MVNIPLLLMGCGGVGRQLLRHIISCRPIHSKQVSHFIASYTHFHYSIFFFFISRDVNVTAGGEAESGGSV